MDYGDIIYNGHEWYDSARVVSKYDKPSNCVNCAAPLTNNGCEYCGTGKQKKIQIKPIRIDSALPQRKTFECYELAFGEFILSTFRRVFGK